MASLPRLINSSEQFSAASPVLESARLVRAARPVIETLIALGVVFGVVAGLTAATSLAATMSARAKDLALLRALGAHPWELATIAAVEACLLALGAVALGLAIAWVMCAVLADMLAAHAGLLLTVAPNANDLVVVAGGALAAAILSALVPAARASRVSIEAVLGT